MHYGKKVSRQRVHDLGRCCAGKVGLPSSTGAALTRAACSHFRQQTGYSPIQLWSKFGKTMFPVTKQKKTALCDAWSVYVHITAETSQSLEWGSCYKMYWLRVSVCVYTLACIMYHPLKKSTKKQREQKTERRECVCFCVCVCMCVYM